MKRYAGLRCNGVEVKIKSFTITIRVNGLSQSTSLTTRSRNGKTRLTHSTTGLISACPCGGLYGVLNWRNHSMWWHSRRVNCRCLNSDRTSCRLSRSRCPSTSTRVWMTRSGRQPQTRKPFAGWWRRWEYHNTSTDRHYYFNAA